MAATKVTLEAGNHDRRFCPVSVEADPSDRPAALKEIQTDRLIPCQVVKEDGRTRLAWILEELKAGSAVQYELVSGDQPESSEVALRHMADRNQVDVLIKEGLFTSYCYGPELARPYLYPLIGPHSRSITRRMAQPEDEHMDHHHHRSVWVSHGDVNGVDNWSEMKGHGRTVHRSFEILESGPVLGHIRSRADWVSAEGNKVLDEVRDQKFYNLPRCCQIIDLRVVLTASEGEITFGDTKEGGIASIRTQPSIEVQNGGRIENSWGGINEKETWGKRAHWCDYSGPVEGLTVGIALFDGAGNFRHPTYWHVRDYGLMTANPFGLSFFFDDPDRRGDYTLKAGEALQFSYRIYIHDGDAKKGNVAQKYHDFANPATASAE